MKYCILIDIYFISFFIGGMLNVEEAPYKTELADAFVEAGVELGYENRDCNAEFQTGFMIPQGTIKKGWRQSTATAFLRPVKTRKNLHISTNSHVTKVRFSSVFFFLFEEK